MKIKGGLWILMVHLLAGCSYNKSITLESPDRQIKFIVFGESGNKEPGSGIRTRIDGEVRRALPFQSPWRIIMVGKDPGDLLEKNYLLLNLNDPSEIKDISWITPGKVLREVSLSTAGGKAAVDFVAAHRMQYIEYDAGWYGPENNNESDPVNPVLDPARSKRPLDLQ